MPVAGLAVDFQFKGLADDTSMMNAFCEFVSVPHVAGGTPRKSTGGLYVQKHIYGRRK